MAINKAINECAKRKRTVGADPDAFPVSGSDPSSSAHDNRIRETLYECLSELNASDAFIIYLRYVEGYHHREILDILDDTRLTYGALRTRICRALKMLKDCMIMKGTETR